MKGHEMLEDLEAYGLEWRLEQEQRAYGEPPADTMADQHAAWHWANGYAQGCPMDCAAADAFWDQDDAANDHWGDDEA